MKNKEIYFTSSTMAGDFINTKKTAFDLYQAVKQHEYTYLKSREHVN